MSADLPPLRDIIAEFGLGARKALGQHFLLDLNITRKIARLSGAGSQDCVLEIGPGPGGLTRALLETGARVIAIEKDRRCIEALQMLEEAYPGKFEIIEADALKVDEAKLLRERQITGRVRIASNLPYNISTELLIKWLKAQPQWWDSLTLMFQKEVGDRILASPGGKTYGRLAVIAQAASLPSHGFDLPARAFTPPPKVDSSVLHFTPADIDTSLLSALEKVTGAAFSQRRKMLRASLKTAFGDGTLDVIDAIGLLPEQRAETVCVSDYLALAARLA